MSAVEHVYSYPGSSQLVSEGSKRSLQLLTSGGAEPNPYFFEGELTRPRVTGMALRGLSRLVGARFFTPPGMLSRILAEADPVITSGRGMLRFEGFSACASAYARIDLSEGAYRGDTVGFGTTNVDFNAEMRAALSGIRDGERVALSVGRSQMALRRAGGELIEKKVPLPVRWVKGFAEVQAYLARMAPLAELGSTEALRFLRGLPRTRSRSPAFLTSSRGSLRLAATATEGAVRVAGLERLRVLEDLAPLAKRLRVHADPRGDATAWELELGELRFTLALSSETWRGFSGEGQVLAALARRRPGSDPLGRLRSYLQWQSRIDPGEVSRELKLTPRSLADSLSILGSQGLVGFDQGTTAYFHRELPFNREQVEALAPRLRAARELFEARAVAVADARSRAYFVTSKDVKHHVVLSAGGEPERCTCPWYSKHQTSRGPCKHQLAAQLFFEETGPGDE